MDIIYQYRDKRLDSILPDIIKLSFTLNLEGIFGPQ